MLHIKALYSDSQYDFTASGHHYGTEATVTPERKNKDMLIFLLVSMANMPTPFLS